MRSFRVWFFFFFFSSRRRHTRCSRDWSSDVCSSDLVQPGRLEPGYVAHTLGWPVPASMYGGGWGYALSDNRGSVGLGIALEYADPQFDPHAAVQTWKKHRSEERRVGEEGRNRGGPGHLK